MKHCRAGKGPITIEASITRFRGHFEGDAQAYCGGARGQAAWMKEMDRLEDCR
ncbi:MAG: hypothetical protein R3E50_13985 [Halioglobus sp.]